MWLKCRAKWPRHHRPKPLNEMSDAMKRYFAQFKFYVDCDVDRNTNSLSDKFESEMERALGLSLVLVDNCGSNGFFHAFCWGYFGQMCHLDVIHEIRGQSCAYVVQFWEMPALRDMIIGTFTQFLNGYDKSFDLLSCLELMSKSPTRGPLTETQQVEVHCLGMVLKCEICILTLRRDGTVQRKRGGDVGADVVVFVVRDDKHQYYALNRPTNECANMSFSVAPYSSSNRPEEVNDQQRVSTTEGLLSDSASVALLDAPVNLGGQFPHSCVTTPTSSVFDDWGKAPPKNTDEHLRPTWPETEKVLRSLNLYNGLWTDAQTLQHANWVDRVSGFFLIYVIRCIYFMFVGKVGFA